MRLAAELGPARTRSAGAALRRRFSGRATARAGAACTSAWAGRSARCFSVKATRSGSVSVPADHGVRLMAVESGRSVLREANPCRPGIAMTRVGETMMRAVAVFVGREV